MSARQLPNEESNEVTMDMIFVGIGAYFQWKERELDRRHEDIGDLVRAVYVAMRAKASLSGIDDKDD